MASVTNQHGLRVVTGGQMGSLDIQFILIKCYNAPFTLTATSDNSYEFISNVNDGLSRIIQVVQDFAEIYYIGWPEANSGGENELTRVIVGINPVTARGLPDANTYPTATYRWTELETALNSAISIDSAEAWFAMPGNSGSGWGWTYDY